MKHRDKKRLARRHLMRSEKKHKPFPVSIFQSRYWEERKARLIRKIAKTELNQKNKKLRIVNVVKEKEGGENK
jgi:hypothetical protein